MAEKMRYENEKENAKVDDEFNNSEDDLSAEDIYRILRETAAVYAIPVLDLYASSGIHAASPLQRERFLPDGIHQFCLHTVQISEQRLAGSAPGGVLYHMGVQIIQGIPG